MRFKYYLRGAGIGVIAATLILSIAFLFQDHISDEEVIRRAIELGMVMEDSASGTLADMQQPGTSAVDLETGADDGPDTSGIGNNDGTGVNDGSGDDSGSQGSADDPVKDSSEDPSDTDPAQEDNAQPDKDSGKDSNNDTNGDSTEGTNKNTDKNNNSDNQDSGSDKDNKDSGKDAEGSGSKNDSESSGNSQTSNKAVITIESGDVSRIVSAKVFEAGLVDSADEFNSYLGEHGYANLLQPGTYEITKGATFRQIAVILTTRR